VEHGLAGEHPAHLASLGARDLPRAEFLDLLAGVRDEPVRLPTDRLPVARLG
jgi:leucyl/phenylalanyl-tRNA--protein transferase